MCNLSQINPLIAYSIVQVHSQTLCNVCPFQVIGLALRECIDNDGSLQVMCQALDIVFDVFGDDNCPLDLFTSLSFQPVLELCRDTFKARVSKHKDCVRVILMVS